MEDWYHMSKKRGKRDRVSDGTNSGNATAAAPETAAAPVTPVVSAAPVASAAPSAPAAPRSRRRQWLFRLVAGAGIPLCLLLLVESGLRLAGYGYSTAYFHQTTIGGRDVWVGNQDFTLRFFPRALARELDRPMVAVGKPAGTTRIFVFGDSAAQGDPAPSFAFSRILEVMLRERHPTRRFEVINTAITAINSHVVLPIARECARLEPDLFVIYMGNNEVIGPYGPATVFTAAAQNLTLLRSAIALKSTRLGQFMDSLVKGQGSARTPESWGGMSMFLGNRIRPDDRRLESVHAHFRQNLRDITAAGTDASAHVIVCTLGVNLRDCPPFASLNRPDLGSADLQRWKTLYDDGIASEAKSLHEQAITAFDAANLIDDTFADLHFRLGRAHAALGHDAQALSAFCWARDLDALPFRATSRTIGIMRQVGSNKESGRIHLADVARANELDSAHGLPGRTLFHEHVHMTFHGNHVAARTVLEQVERVLGVAATGAIPSENDCAKALGHGTWEELRIDQEMHDRISQPPFSDQLDHAGNLARLETDIARLHSSEQPDALAAADAVHREALERQPDDWRLREVFARFLLEGRRDAAGAAEQFRLVLERIPFDYHAHYNLAVALREHRQDEEAATHFQHALRIKPDFFDATCGLGTLRAAQNRSEEASALFRSVLQHQPTSAEAHLGLGRLAEAQGQHDDALIHFAAARSTPAQMSQAHNRLAITQAKSGNHAAAEAGFRKALALDSGNADAHFNLGNLLSRKGDKDAALTSFGEAVRLKPDLAEAHAQIGALLLAKRQLDRAIEAHRVALRLKPEMATAHNSLGVALASQGRLAEAVVHFAEAVRLRPDLIDAQRNLDHARAQLAAPR